MSPILPTNPLLGASLLLDRLLLAEGIDAASFSLSGVARGALLFPQEAMDSDKINAKASTKSFSSCSSLEFSNVFI